MQNNRKLQAAQQKQWKQQYKIISRKLDQNQKSYIKNLTIFAQASPEISHTVHNILSEHQTSIKKNEKESTHIFAKFHKIYEPIEQLRQLLKYFDKTNQSLLKVQKLSEGVFNRMQTMKNEMAVSYDELDDLQRKFTSDLELIDRRIQSFDNQQQNLHNAPATKKIKNKQNLSVENKQTKSTNLRHKSNNRQNQDEVEQEQIKVSSKLQQIQVKMKIKQDQVEQVDEQIRVMGKYLGWHQQDHKDFVTIWNRNQANKNYFQIQDQLLQYFKMYTNQQIIEHMNNYMKLKKLTEKKKILIAEYKQLKQQKKSQQIIKLKSNQQEILKKIRQQQMQKKAELQQKQMKQKVEHWKKQKQQQKHQQKRKLIQQQQRRKQQQMAKKRQQQARRKQILQNWKIQQEQKQKKQKESSHAHKRPKSAINKQTKQRIRQREQQIIKEKMEKAIQKKMMEQQLQKKAEKIREQKLIKYAHVKPKLQQKTTAVKQKQRQKFDGKQKKDACTFGGQLLLTGIRAIPQWRQGL